MELPLSLLVIVGGTGGLRFATVENGGVSTSEREEQASWWSMREFRKTSSMAIGASHSVPPEPF